MKEVTIQRAPQTYTMVVDGKAVVFSKGKALVEDELADKIVELAKKNKNPYIKVKATKKPKEPKKETTKKASTKK